jgi:hypothetical protein
MEAPLHLCLLTNRVGAFATSDWVVIAVLLRGTIVETYSIYRNLSHTETRIYIEIGFNLSQTPRIFNISLCKIRISESSIRIRSVTLNC